MKAFENWTFEDVQDVFGIKKVKKQETLQNWLSASVQPDVFQEHTILQLKTKLGDLVDTWNEDELKFQFLGPFLNVVNFDTDKYKVFTQRTLTLKTDKVEASGRVDYMVATGLLKPRQPFFFFHEYKPARRGTNDPLGQLLIEMISGKEQNLKNFPIYGCFVEGKYWNFIVLQHNEYTVSESYDATTNDIMQIYSILCKVKEYIEEMMKN